MEGDKEHTDLNVDGLSSGDSELKPIKKIEDFLVYLAGLIERNYTVSSLVIFTLIICFIAFDSGYKLLLILIVLVVSKLHIDDYNSKISKGQLTTLKKVIKTSTIEKRDPTMIYKVIIVILMFIILGLGWAYYRFGDIDNDDLLNYQDPQLFKSEMVLKATTKEKETKQNYEVYNSSSIKVESKKESKKTKQIDYQRYNKEVNNYFKEIVFKTEFDGSKENPGYWENDMNIFVEGEKKEYLINELEKVVAELNAIIDPIKINIVSDKDKSNFIVFFGSHVEFKDNYNLSSPKRLKNNWGYFETTYSSGIMYVDLYRIKDEESHKHLLREELTQSLGLLNDSWKYPESIFYQGWTTTTEFAPIDIYLIDLLYN